MKPIIGLLGEVDDARASLVNYAYINAVEGSGGVPMLLPYTDNADTMREYIALCDGFIFTGGADIAPERYGEALSPACGSIQKYRDEFELAMFREVYNKTKKPILAICRGIQLVNVALGGTLYQDIPSEIPSEIQHRQLEPKDAPSHSVTVAFDTPLSQIVGGEKRITANSFHHQAIKTLGRGLSVMALADDGIIEAVYADGERYMRAYQWHPERLCNTDINNRRIFDDFIASCKKEK